MKTLGKRIEKDNRGQQTIVVVLILILVGVGVSIALFVWLSDWQEETQGSVQNVDTGVDTGGDLYIMGSTSVQPLADVAAEAFMEDFPMTHVYVSGGGSGAGRESVNNGLCDIGMSSSTIKSSQYPDLIPIKVGYDGVVPITSASNEHGLVSMNTTIMSAIYYYNGGATVIPGDTSTIGTVEWFANELDDDNDGAIQWDEINTTAAGGTLCTGSEDIIIYDRSDESGTEECWTKKIVDGGGDQFEELGISATGVDGNAKMLQAVAGDQDGLGFAAFGYVAASSTVTEIEYGEEGSVQGATHKLIRSGDYVTSRSLYFATLGAPDEESLAYRFIEYCLTPQNNQDFCAASGYTPLDKTEFVMPF